MKLQTSKKQIRNCFNTVLSVGYCSAQYLLYYSNPFAYSAGIYGWTCDYYQIGNVCISTGYSPIGKSINYYLLIGLEKQAEKIVNNHNMDYSAKKEAVNALLVEFINQSK